jgi:CRISPR-associated endonuclease/helicase Cas3
LETEKFFDPSRLRGGYPSIYSLQEKLASFLEKFSNPQSAINMKRTDLLNEALAQADADKGLFSLTIPTGGGKTYTSLAFALSHAKKHGLKRIIYCIPFTSIIEQNADVIRECLGNDVVLEHHSNFDWNEFRSTQNEELTDDQTNALFEKLKLSSENWDIPIVVTTNVQFFESLFSNRPSRCRKIHSLVNSVIIFDEAQVLPFSYLEPCMLSLAELIVNYNSSVIFSTATQPPLHQFFPETIQQRELISSPNDVYQFFKRVNVVNLGTQNDDQISQSINSTRQALCIVNTRRHAKGLYNKITFEGRFHLSTLMCPAHRKKVINDIRNRLDNNDECRVISTQIMEAGIDVDFPIGFRSLAGLDSIVQAAGRVNRENKRDIGILYIFKPDSDFIKRMPSYIKQTASVAEIIIGQFEDPISLEAITAYYNLLYDIQDSHVFDKKEIMSCFEKGIIDEPDFDFKTASERFKMIENDTFPIIIPYNDQAEELIQKLRFTDFPTSLLRPLQPYTVNIYAQELESLFALSDIEILHDRFLVLSTLEEVYNDETGLVIPEGATGDAIFISS